MAHRHDPDPTWEEHALKELSDAGFHNGASRRRVIEMLGGQECAITALDLDDRLDGVGRATVYRALEQMEDLGLVQKIDMGGESAGYEKVDPEGHHHHHIVCTDCGKVIPFEDFALEKAIHAISKRDGFTIQSHDITLRGTCERCT
ncbi:MAG: Fur family transcriptional regulator [Solirubrobacterales bacterium]